MLIHSPSPLFEHEDVVPDEDVLSQKDGDKVLQSCQPIEQFLELKSSSNDTDVESTLLDTDLPRDLKYDVLEYDGEGINEASLDQYYVPLSLIERWGSAMGILGLSN